MTLQDWGSITAWNAVSSNQLCQICKVTALKNRVAKLIITTGVHGKGVLFYLYFSGGSQPPRQRAARFTRPANLLTIRELSTCFQEPYMKSALVIASAFSICSVAAAETFSIEFDTGVAEWRTVLDGVMGGRSTGRVTQPEAGVLRFSGELSLENNGGFSQIQAMIPEAAFKDAIGIGARVRGDGRTYQFNVRSSDVRIRAGSFQTKFDTVAGEWVTLSLPFDEFRLYSFGRPVSDAPKLIPARVESVGVTIADKNPGAFQLDIEFIRAIGPAREGAKAGSNLTSIDGDNQDAGRQNPR